MISNNIIDNKMLFSDVIYAWNCVESLDRTLMQMCLLRIPTAVGWELSVVNDHSTDCSVQVIAQHAALSIRQLFEDSAQL